MRQPRTFSERLELLNRLNRRQAVLPGVEEDDESEDEAALGAEEDDSGSELDDNLDDSDDNGSISDSDSEDDFSGEEEDSEDEEEEEGEEGEEEEEGEGAVLPTAPPAAGAPTPGVGQPEASEAPEASADPESSEAPEASANPEWSEAPEASANPEASEASEASASPESPAGSMTIINPAPTGVANNPAVPPSAADPELSTTEQVVSQITSAAEEATPSTSNSLAQEEQEGTETASDAEASATSEESNEGGEGSAQALGRGEQAGIIFGAVAGLGLLMSVGVVLFKWRKRRKASVYDRPPPPGIYSEEEKRDAEVAVTQVPEEQPVGQARGGSMFQVVNSWIQGTPNRYSRGAEVAPPPPAFLTPGRNRDTVNTGITGVTGSEAKWG